MADNDDRVTALETRVAALEAQIAELTAIRTPKPAATPPGPPPPPVGPPVDVARSNETAPPASEGAATGRGPAIDSETALKWGGVGLVVLAVAFGVSTAVQRGWIGPTLQLAGAAGFGLALVAAGTRLRSTRRPWTHALCAGGVAVLYVTAASDLFGEWADPDTGHVTTAVIALASVALARFVESEWVGVTTLTGGTVGWLVIADGTTSVAATGIALAAATVVMHAVSLERRWFGLRLLTHTIGLLAVLGLASSADTEQVVIMAAAVIVAVALLQLPSTGEIRPPWRPIEIQLATLLAPWAWLVVAITFVDTDTAAGVIALVSAAVVAALAVARRPQLLDGHFAALIVGASVSCTVGAGLVLSTDVAWVAVAVQGAGLVVLHRALPEHRLLPINAAGLLAAATVWVFADGVAAWRDDAAVGSDLARLAVLAIVAVGVWLTGARETRQLGGATVGGLTLVWLGSVLVHLPQGQALVSLSWAVVGGTVLVTGAVRKIPALGNAGLVVLAVTVAKLLLVDLAEVDALWRAGLFLFVGLGFLRLGFLLPRWTGGADDSVADDTVPVEPG